MMMAAEIMRVIYIYIFDLKNKLGYNIIMIYLCNRMSQNSKLDNVSIR